MTPLRQRMLEDMQVRNLSPHTQASYCQQVSQFARYFGKSPEDLGPEDIRTYQVYLTNERNLAPVSILIAVAAIRFLYKVTLKRNWVFEEVIPTCKKPQKLPEVLSPEEVLQSARSCADPQAAHNPDDVLCGWSAGLRGHPPKGGRNRQSKDGHSRGAREGAERPLRDAVTQAARHPPRLLAHSAAEGMVVPRRSSRVSDHVVIRRAGLQAGPPQRRNNQACHAAFPSPRLRRASPRVRHRCPHDPASAGAPRPRHDRPLFADCHQQGLFDIQPA